jgi:hypothetical protein
MRLAPYLAALALCGYFSTAAASTGVPNTLEDAFASLDSSLKPDQKLAFMQRQERQAVIEAHFAVGLYIRNEWLRTGKSSLVGTLQSVGARSYDDMSAMILTSYWRHLHGVKIALKEQGACYRRWWLEQQKLIDESKAKGQDSYRMPDFYCP